MKYSKVREIDDKVRELVRDGWRIYPGGRHLRIEHPSTGFVFSIVGRPGDTRSVRNWFSQFRRAERAGFDPRVFYGKK